MDRPHDPACDGNHTARQRCKVPMLETALGGGTLDRLAPLGPKQLGIAIALELAPIICVLGLAFLGVAESAGWLVSVDLSWRVYGLLVLILMATLFCSGLGWACVNRFDIAVVAFILRIVLSLLVLVSLGPAIGSDCESVKDSYCANDPSGAWPVSVAGTLWLLMPPVSAGTLWLTQRERVLQRPSDI